jgi:hypothetical protein
VMAARWRRCGLGRATFSGVAVDLVAICWE